jgi:NADH-quinone oxidoreductase subunit N
MEQFFRLSDIGAITPELYLTFFGMILLIADLVEPQKRRLGAYALMGLAAAAVFLVYKLHGVDGTAYGGVLVFDSFSWFFRLLFLIGAAISIIMSMKYLDIEREHHGEYYALILFATMGMMFMAGAVDLITLYIGLETMAISTYILVGFLRGNQRSNEASLKYFLLGAFSSGILLYGMSLLYGISGSTRFIVIADALTRRGADPISVMAMITLSAGMFFKIAAVPFHQWTPDAYEGAPTSITAFMSVAVKAASFAMMIRVFVMAIGPLRAEWLPIMVGVSILTMTVGNIAAITQSNLKRLLAYSSISHAGYILLGLIAGNETGMIAIPLYLMVYTFTNLGAWALIIALRRRDVIGEHIEEMSGLFFKHPVAAILMLIFLLSLAGIPPTAGFIAKYYLFASVIESGHYSLAVIAVLNAAISLYFYLRIVVAMFMRDATEKTGLSLAPGLVTAMALAFVFTMWIGLYPDPFISIAKQAILSNF